MKTKPHPWPVTPSMVDTRYRSMWDGLLGVWPLWDMGGTDIVDVGPNRLDGTVGGVFSAWQDWTRGRYIPAESVMYGSVPHDAALSPGGDELTLAVAYYDFDGGATEPTGYLLSKSQSVWDYGIDTIGRPGSWGTINFHINIGGKQTLTYNGPAGGADWLPLDNKLVTVVCTYDGSNMRICMNGVERASQAMTGTLSHATDKLGIGSQHGNGANILGPNAGLFCAAISKRAWSAGEREAFHLDPCGMFRRAEPGPVNAAAVVTSSGPFFHRTFIQSRRRSA